MEKDYEYNSSTTSSSIESDSLLLGRGGRQRNYNGTTTATTAAAAAATNVDGINFDVIDNDKTNNNNSSDGDNDGDNDNDGGGSDDGGGKTSSVTQVSINMTKMCIGTGVLALPYATNEAGLLWYVVGLSLVTTWNIYSTDRLLKCQTYMEEFSSYSCSYSCSHDYSHNYNDDDKHEDGDKDDENDSEEGDLSLVITPSVPVPVPGPVLAPIPVPVSPPAPVPVPVPIPSPIAAPIPVRFPSASSDRDLLADGATTVASTSSVSVSESKRRTYRSTSGERVINFDDDHGHGHNRFGFDNDGGDGDINNSSNKNTSTFGKVALFAFGKPGLHFIDTSMMILMFGIIIAYEDAILGFIHNTPIASGNKYMDASIMILIITPLASLSDFSVISKVSALGTFIILLLFVAIGWYGVHENGITGFMQLDEQQLYPNGFSGFSAWYGCVAFGFGTVPFTFNLQESMKHPDQMMKATRISLWIVCVIYILMGELVSIIFWPSIHGIQTDVISILPSNGLLTVVMKLSMTMVILLTTPLIIVPCGDLVQRKLGFHITNNNNNNSNCGHDEDGHGPNNRIGTETIIRISVCILCGCISVLVPNFVFVISFFGCLCVSLIGFVYPPIAHMRCLLRLRSRRRTVLSSLDIQQMVVDAMILPIGFISCIFTSYLTFQTMMEEMNKSMTTS